ncbi:MAG: ATP synthase subunit I [Acidobacteriia bacterium]|nr:ATP synthase subunit I [Terriglobia bacterium]
MMAIARAGNLERRLFWLTLGLTAGGSLLAWAGFGGREAVSFAAGAGLAGANLFWLRSTINSIFTGDLKRSKSKVLAGFFLRLLLIPLCLYAMIRFLFLDILAAVAGLAVFICSVFIEGVLEAYGSSPE